MTPFLLLPSTTSHKKEPLGTTLEVFSRLGMRDLDLNLHHLMETGLSIDDVHAALAAGDHRVWMASGGWCDFYQHERIGETFASVDRQVAMTRALGVNCLRLFFGRLGRSDYSAGSLATIARNLRRLSESYPDMQFVFENHDGASLSPAICRDILETVARPNIRMNFDPINFERAGVDSMAALRALRPHIAHVHLKGCQGAECCEFGRGDVDLTRLLRSLIQEGYRGSFTVEYEGVFDRTVRLYESVQRARAVLATLTTTCD